ncbi:MAG: hypothetical protein ACTSV7_13025 [Candidatus Baldrarchaeia archaeon]|nr:MAG: hypothetical protein B6U95_05820 [Thermofilum sp. ex4484_82]
MKLSSVEEFMNYARSLIMGSKVVRFVIKRKNAEYIVRISNNKKTYSITLSDRRRVEDISKKVLKML